METKGKIDTVGEVQVISEKYRKIEVIQDVTTNPEYPKFVKVQIANDKIDKINFKEGDNVMFEVNAGSDKFEKDGKVMVFNNLDAWKWELLQESTPENSNPGLNPDDDLPFS